jgi:mannose-1-phosphate guanylyltransferase
MISPDAKISPNAVIGPNVTIDSGCVIEDGVRLKNTVVLKGCLIKSHAWVDNSIIGWKSTVGKWARIEGTTVLGEDV